MSQTEFVTDSPLDPAAIEPGTNVLVAGAPMTKKRAVMVDLLETPDRAAMLATTKRSAAKLQSQLENRHGNEDWDYRIVDCVSKHRAVAEVRETETVRYASDAGDLTGIGIQLSGFMQEFYHRDDLETVRLGFDSLSPVLMYSDMRRVYQFLHVVTGRIASSDFSGVFTLDTVGGDGQVRNQLMQIFDALIEIRETKRGRELRVRGDDFGPREWTAF